MLNCHHASTPYGDPGCFQSKMELAIKEAYQAKGLIYGRNRVFNNYSGNRFYFSNAIIFRNFLFYIFKILSLQLSQNLGGGEMLFLT